MKKFLFATLMFLGVAVVSNAKTFVKTTIHKNPTNTVRPVSPAAISSTKAATDKTATKHKKHKKHHKAPKNEPKK